MIRQLIVPGRGENAEEQAENNGKNGGKGCHFKGGGDGLRQVLQHRPLGADGGTPVAGQEILDVIEVLNRDRLIQSPFFRVGGDDCGVAHGRLPQVGRQRVTGDIMGNAEGNDGHTRQHDDHKQYSS